MVKILLSILFTLVAGMAQASTVVLQWDPVTAPDLAGYRIYYSNSGQTPFDGSTGASEGTSPVSVGNVITGTLTGLPVDRTWYFAVTAYNSAGVESPYSNIVRIASEDWTSDTMIIKIMSPYSHMIRSSDGKRVRIKIGGMQ